jgi:hypothetical protein
MLDQYSVSENGYFFSDVSEPTVPIVSYGDLSPPVPIRFTVPEPGVTTFETSETEIDDWYMPIFVNEENCIDDFFLCAVFVFVEAHDIEVDDWYPFRAENINNFEGGRVIAYEDAEVILNNFVYDANDKLISYIETNKATSAMIQYSFTRSAGPGLEAIGSNEDYQTFAFTGQVELLSDDVPNASIENYEVIQTVV